MPTIRHTIFIVTVLCLGFGLSLILTATAGEQVSEKNYNCLCIFNDINVEVSDEDIYWLNYRAVCPQTNASKYISNKYPSLNQANIYASYINGTVIECCDAHELELNECYNSQISAIIMLMVGLFLSAYIGTLLCFIIIRPLIVSIRQKQNSGYNKQGDEIIDL